MFRPAFAIERTNYPVVLYDLHIRLVLPPHASHVYSTT